MTVTYSREIATATFQAGTKLLFRWKGSVVKLVWRELLAFLGAYFFVSIIYRFALNSAQQRTFNKLAIYCEKNNNLIPIAFALGFFVTFVVGRWWEQFKNIPWPDRAAMCIATCLHGRDEDSRLIRRTIVRYLNLATILVLSSICIPVKKRFPTLQHITDAGVMQPNEQLIYESTPCSFNKFFIPLIWAGNILSNARKENRVKDDITYRMIMDELLTYRSQLGMLLNYDWICVPLVYTQVVTISVYAFFLFCLFGRQFLSNSEDLDPIIPVFTVLQFVFYMGWFKVAETLLNPFGEDDDDFDVNQLMDRHLQVAYLMVDGMHANYPIMTKDQYWNSIDFQMPYTIETQGLRDQKPYKGSVIDLTVNQKTAAFTPLRPIPEEHSGTSLINSDTNMRDYGTRARLTWPYPEGHSQLTGGGHSQAHQIRRPRARNATNDDDINRLCTSIPAEMMIPHATAMPVPQRPTDQLPKKNKSDNRLIDKNRNDEEIFGDMELDEQLSADKDASKSHDDGRRHSDYRRHSVHLSSVPESMESLTNDNVVHWADDVNDDDTVDAAVALSHARVPIRTAAERKNSVNAERKHLESKEM